MLGLNFQELKEDGFVTRTISAAQSARESSDYNVRTFFRSSFLAGKFKVGDWTVVPDLNTLERGGRSLRLQPKVMQVLLVLADSAGEVITKESILNRVWPGTFVSDEVLTHSISELRKIFQDNPRESGYIQTISKAGYRLVAPVTQLVAEQNETMEPRRPFRAVWLFASAALAIAALVTAFLLMRRGPHVSPEPAIHSLAILPLANLSGDAEQEYFADGMTDELTTRLSQIGALRVISRTSMMRYKGTKKSIPEIAHELNVDAVLEGSVLRSGNRVRISAELIQGSNDKHVWAESYERDIGEVLALQANVASVVADAISIQITSQQRDRFANARRVNPQALDLVLKGRYHWSKFSDSELRKAISYFQQAIDIDPTYAVAYAGLADCYHELGDAPPKEIFPKARAAAQRALQLDPGLADAYSALGWVEWTYDWQWSSAERDFLHSIELNPNYSNAHGMYAEYLDSMGRFAEAEKERTISMQLSPLEPIIYANAAEHLTYMRDYDRAIENCNEALNLDPTFVIAQGRLSQIYWIKSMQAESLAHLIETTSLKGDHKLAEQMKAAQLGGGYKSAIRVRLDANRFARERGQWVSLTDDAWYLLSLGDKDRALAALEKSIADRDPLLTSLAVDPLFDSVRSDPRFSTILARIGLQK
jgi:TolB-like protein/DNA-binding winged helix-turn-helix (wHTH) protein